MEAEQKQNCPPNPIPQLSSIANSVVFRCSKIVQRGMKELKQCFEMELDDHVEQPCVYARSLVQYCSYKALDVMTKPSDHLADKELRELTFDMMLAYEAPDIESETANNATIGSKDLEYEDDDGLLFYTSSTSMAIQDLPTEEPLLDLGCRSKGELAKAHRSCIDTWF